MVFSSSATNLTAGTPTGTHYYVHDRVNLSLERLNVASDGTTIPSSFGAGVSDDGQVLVFGSWNGSVQQLYVRERASGTTSPISAASMGVEGLYGAQISANGRFVSMVCYAGDAYNACVYDRLLQTGSRIPLAGILPDPLEYSAVSAAISADGRYVVFTASLGDSSAYNVYAHDRQLGTSEKITQSANIGTFDNPAISADGRFVGFASSANDIVPNDSNGQSDVFVFDRLNLATERVSVNSNEAQTSGRSQRPALSSEGRYAVFTSTGKLVADDTNQRADIYLRDRQAGTTVRVSLGL